MLIDRKMLSFLGPELLDEIEKNAIVREFPRGTEILREEQYIKVLPIVLKGLIKVFSRYEEKELLLYYIEPAQSCVMTFYAALKNAPSKIYATTEEDSQVLLIPVQHLNRWLKDYPGFNEMFYEQYNIRYSDLLDTIGHLLVDRMDKRLFDHLKRKSDLISAPLKMSHNQLANEIGTSREVVTRILKRLETEGKVIQDREGIKITGRL